MNPCRSTHTLTATSDDVGLRLDRWLAERLPHLSRARLQALLAEGHVLTADGSTPSPSRKVTAGLTVSVAEPEAEPAAPQPQAMPLVIVHEDPHLMVIDKPAGLVVHPGAGTPDGTLVNALLAHCGDTLPGIGGVRRPGIVHRIDKDTSGLLVVAKTDAAYRGLAEQFAAHNLERAYLAVTLGVPAPASGTITGAIGRHPNDRKRMAVVTRGGKAATTHYRTLETFGTAAALLECRLETGRTHQIRVHLAGQGHPLVGDSVYAGRPGRHPSGPPGHRAAIAGFRRQALHAAELGFRHPADHTHVSFRSAIPADINGLLDALRA